jgi:hypothetical protein
MAHMVVGPMPGFRANDIYKLCEELIVPPLPSFKGLILNTVHNLYIL